MIKLNLTCRARTHSSYTAERSMGIVTDAFFVEGVIESLKELGIASGQFYIREVNCPDDLEGGIHQVSWNSSEYPSGYYICRLNYGGFTKVRKMVVVH